MAGSLLIRYGSVTGSNGVLVAMQHNKRTLPNDKEHIDATRTHLNYSLVNAETPEAIAIHAKVQMLKAGIEKPRKNGVMAVECIISLPIDRHAQDTKPFFSDSFEWVKLNFAGELLAFDIHLDESAPHAHAVILPLIDGKMQGDKVKGGIANIRRLNSKFHTDVACHYGLSLSEAKRLSAMDKQTLDKLVITRLENDNDAAMKSSVWHCFRDLIRKDPLPFAQMLSIKLTATTRAKGKSFVQIMTSKGKGSNTNPI